MDMEEYPEESLLSSGVAIHIGGCDKTGHPLIILPTEHQSGLVSLPSSEILRLLSYFKQIVPAPQRLNGFTYLINLSISSQKVITQLITSLNAIQLSSDGRGLVHALYAIKPKTSKNVKLLEKLTGLKPSKKSSAMNLFEVHILKDFASLHRSVDKVSLTEEFGGHQQVSIQGWAQFRLKVDAVTVDIGRCQGQLGEAKDEMNIICELDIPPSSEQTQPLLHSINMKYTKIMGCLKLEHIIDKCSALLDELNSSKGQVKFAQGDLLRDTIKYIRTNQKELTETREQLQMQWRKALARVVQAGQLMVHQKNANKIIKWIERNGRSSLLELSSPASSSSDVKKLLRKTNDLYSKFQELEKEAEYIQTDVEYMALQDVSEFTHSLAVIGKMSSEMDNFNSALSKVKDKLDTVSTLFTNVAKCFSWYSQLLSSLPTFTNADEFYIACAQSLEKFKDTAPPSEWLQYIEHRLELVEDRDFRSNATVLLQRIACLCNMYSTGGDNFKPLTVNQWREDISGGFTGLAKCRTHPSVSAFNDRKHSQNSKKLNFPKLKVSSRAADSSTDDVEGSELPPRGKRLAKNRKSPSTRDQLSSSKGSTNVEAYVDLSDNVKVTQLPNSLSHVNLERFLENEPEDEDGMLASSTPVDGLQKIHGAEANNQSRRKKNRKKESLSVLDPLKVNKKKYRKRHDETDDSCPNLSDYLNTTRVSLPSSEAEGGPHQSIIMSQSHRLPFHPIADKERLERIYSSTSPSLERKLDMMAALIEDGDDSCFFAHPLLEKRRTDDSHGPGGDGRPSPPQIGKLTPANISKELSSDLSYSEHIHHWLSKQEESKFTPREDVPLVGAETESLKNCIARAEKLLQDGMPEFSDVEDVTDERVGYPVNQATRGSNDRISKSADSGITDLTARDAHQYYRSQRYASRESGLDSDVTGYTATSSEPTQLTETGKRPRQVPPLWLNQSSGRGVRARQRVTPFRRHINHQQ